MALFCGAILAMLVLLPANLRAQLPGTAPPSPFSFQQAQSPEAAPSPSKRSKSSTETSHKSADKRKKEKRKENDETEGQQTKRMLWVVPNFAAVSENVPFTELSTRKKFALATEDSFDYSSFTWTGIEAAQGLALRSDPELGTGMSGYGSYYWHNYVDGVSGTFFTEAIVPVLTHEDPRYFTLGHGGFFRRTEYALSRTFLTKNDSGGITFNWSEVGGNLLEAGLSNAYYPAQERTISQTMQNWGVQMESAALNNLAKEFWPDVRRKVLRQK